MLYRGIATARQQPPTDKLLHHVSRQTTKARLSRTYRVYCAGRKMQRQNAEPFNKPKKARLSRIYRVQYAGRKTPRQNAESSTTAASLQCESFFVTHAKWLLSERQKKSSRQEEYPFNRRKVGTLVILLSSTPCMTVKGTNPKHYISQHLTMWCKTVIGRGLSTWFKGLPVVPFMKDRSGGFGPSTDHFH